MSTLYALGRYPVPEPPAQGSEEGTPRVEGTRLAILFFLLLEGAGTTATNFLNFSDPKLLL